MWSNRCPAKRRNGVLMNSKLSLPWVPLTLDRALCWTQNGFLMVSIPSIRWSFLEGQAVSGLSTLTIQVTISKQRENFAKESGVTMGCSMAPGSWGWINWIFVFNLFF